MIYFLSVSEYVFSIAYFGMSFKRKYSNSDEINDRINRKKVNPLLKHVDFCDIMRMKNYISEKSK